MAVTLPNGSLIHLGTTLGASKTMSAVSNAATAVATLEASHGIVDTDVMIVTSGWSRLTNKILRADNVAVNDVELEGFDSSDTTLFPAAGGTGSIQEVTAWTQLQQILTATSSGGEQNFTEYQFLEADQKVRIPSSKNPFGVEFSIADDPTLAGYIAAAAANDDRVPRAIRVTLPNGSIIYYYAYVSLNKIPSLTIDEVMACQVTLSLLNEPTRYAS